MFGEIIRSPEIKFLIDIHYHKSQIRRPIEPALIRVVEPETGDIAYEVDASDVDLVVFNDRSIVFTPSSEAMLRGDRAIKSQYELRLDEGVAMTKAGGCGSEAAKWQFAVKGMCV